MTVKKVQLNFTFFLLFFFFSFSSFLGLVKNGFQSVFLGPYGIPHAYKCQAKKISFLATAIWLRPLKVYIFWLMLSRTGQVWVLDLVRRGWYTFTKVKEVPIIEEIIMVWHTRRKFAKKVRVNSVKKCPSTGKIK